MSKKKLTDEQVDELRQTYEAWNPHDPASETAEELAARFGITKQTLYSYRKAWMEEDRHVGKTTTGGDERLDQIRALSEELVIALARIRQLERELDEYRNEE